GGSASVVGGVIDHTIEMQAQGKSIRMFVLYDRYPGLVLAVTKAGQAKGIKTIADLRGAKIGVTAPGSSTHFFAQYLLARNGVPVDQESYIGLATASVRALRWIKTHPAEQIAEKMPERFLQADSALYVASLKENLEMFSPDGRIPLVGLETIAKVLSSFDKTVVANAGRVNPVE